MYARRSVRRTSVPKGVTPDILEYQSVRRKRTEGGAARKKYPQSVTYPIPRPEHPSATFTGRFARARCLNLCFANISSVLGFEILHEGYALSIWYVCPYRRSSFHPRQVPVAIASMDRDGLDALFHSANGAEWTKNDNWNTDAELSTWYGVEVDGEDRVVMLSLNANNLRGMPAPVHL